MQPTDRMQPIRSVLVANRGEIARRVMRTARAMGIITVAVYSDADDGAPHMREADQAVRLVGSTPADTYLRGDLIIAAARATGADAIHPGYGFLSENEAFARECATARLTFIGPSPEAIRQMGSKVGAKQLMADAGVPVLPGYTVTPKTTSADLASAADEISYPVLVKASFGGGGRGMRIVRDPDALIDEVAQAQREAAAAFGDGTVFLEKYIEGPRHIEVQIFGDHHGTVISLFERECSIQRRHQKIIEEAPSPVVNPEQREALGAAARAAGESLGYVGAGTVEFVMDAEGRFFFLEVNTRLQVEHPVTELITGLDLVRMQIEIAQGASLPTAAIEARIHGHAIEARLYAEDVEAGFVPTSGPIHRLHIPETVGLRVDSGYEDGSAVSTFYDAMISKVIAWAPTRAEATTILADALRRAEIHGVVTNRDLLVNTLRHAEFVAGRTDTAFLERNDFRTLGIAGGVDATRQLHALAAALAPERAAKSPHPPDVPRGWRNVGTHTATTVFHCGDDEVLVTVQRARGGVTAAINGESAVTVRIIHELHDFVEFELLGRRHRVRLHHIAGHVYADSADGSTDLVRVPRFALPERHVAAGSLLSPMPGTVVAVRAAVGDVVSAGQVLVALEAMKMEHSIRAPVDGVVTEVRVVAGDQVETGAILIVVGEADTEPESERTEP